MSAGPIPEPTRTAHTFALIAACAVTKLAILLLSGTRYGYLADELYFLDAAAHPALGYVDFPPGIAWIIAAHTSVFGEGLFGLRALACLTGILVSALAVDVSRLLGGRLLAQSLTALVAVFAPAFLSVQSILTMNVFDQLWWVLGFWLLIRYLDTRNPATMLALGGAFGLALLTKLSIPYWILALGTTALVHARWLYARREVWQGAVIALVVASPFAYWQVREGWPFLEFVHAYNASKPEAMVIDQPLFGLVMTMNPPFAMLWLPGLVWGLITRDPTARVLGTAAALTLALMLASGVKFYFATPLFVIFTALGAGLWERWLRGRRVAAALFVGGLGLSGALSVPIAAPVLPAAQLQRLADFVRDGEQGRPGVGPAPLGRYFPHFAEMHGWPELVAATERHYLDIPAVERGGVTLVAAYFGQAGALNRLDRQDALPAAHSGHMNYHLWSAGTDFSDVLLVGFTPEEIAPLYGRVDVLGRHSCERCMQREQGLYFLRAQSPTMDSEEIRHHIKRFYFF